MRIQKLFFPSRDIRRMYLEAFPPKERMPFPLLVAIKTGFWTQGIG